jgi:hypothetical protein
MYGRLPSGKFYQFFCAIAAMLNDIFCFRKIVLNNWLLNPTGNPFSWVEADLMQEHMNYWIKVLVFSCFVSRC